MKIFPLSGLAILAAALCGCANMGQAGSQDIQLALTPTNAACTAFQHDVMVGQAAPGGQSITVPRSPGATDIVCYADGYKDKRIAVVPDSPGIFGALLSDFGPVEMAAYPARLQIVMEPSGRQGQPR